MKKRIDLLTLFILCIGINPLSAGEPGDDIFVDPATDLTVLDNRNSTEQKVARELQEEDARRRAEAERLRAEKEHAQHLRDDNGSQHQNSDTTSAKTPSDTSSTVIVTGDNNDAGAAKLTRIAEEDLKTMEEQRKKEALLEEQRSQQTPEETDPFAVSIPSDFNSGDVKESAREMKDNFESLYEPEEIAEARKIVVQLQNKIKTIMEPLFVPEAKKYADLQKAFLESLQKSEDLLKKQTSKVTQKVEAKLEELAKEELANNLTLTNIPKALLKNNLIALRVEEIQAAKDKLNSEQKIKAQQIIKTLNDMIQSMIKNGPEQKRFWILKKWSNEQQNALAAQLLEAEQTLRGLYRTTPVATTEDRVTKPSLVDQVIPKKFIKRFKLQAYEAQLKAVIDAFRNEEPSDQANKAGWTKQNQQIKEAITTLQKSLRFMEKAKHAQESAAIWLNYINRIINGGNL